MKKQFASLVLLGILGLIGAHAQSRLLPGPPFLVGLSGGAAFPFAKLRHEDPVYQVMFNNPSSAGWLDVPSPMAILGDHWVISAHFQLAPGREPASKRASFTSLMQRRFGGDYDVDAGRTRLFDAVESGHFWMKLGFGYRQETENWILMPQLQVGVLNIDRYQAEAWLKARGTNRWFRHSISMDPEKEHYLSLSPAFWLGRALSPRFEVYAQGRIDWSPVHFAIEEQTLDILNREVLFEKKENYTRNLISAFWGLGIFYRVF